MSAFFELVCAAQESGRFLAVGSLQADSLEEMGWLASSDADKPVALVQAYNLEGLVLDSAVVDTSGKPPETAGYLFV